MVENRSHENLGHSAKMSDTFLKLLIIALLLPINRRQKNLSVYVGTTQNKRVLKNFQKNCLIRNSLLPP